MKSLKMGFLLSFLSVSLVSFGNGDEQRVAGQPANCRDSRLITAIIEDDIEKVRKEVNEGANVNFINSDSMSQWTPLMEAAAGGNTQIAGFLIDKGAQVNYLDDYDRNPLTIAVAKNDNSMAELLIKAGGNVNQMSIEGIPLTLAIQHKNSYLIDLLLTNGAQVDIAIPRCPCSGPRNYTPLQMIDPYDASNHEMIRTIEKHLSFWQKFKWQLRRLCNC